MKQARQLDKNRRPRAQSPSFTLSLLNLLEKQALEGNKTNG